MSNNLYITAMEPRSGKSVVLLGIMEMLSRRIRQVGFFRPVVHSSPELDNDIQLVISRYNPELSYEETYGYTHEEAQNLMADGQYNELLKNIVSKYKALEGKCRFVLCEGTDFTGVSSAFEFDFNADVANNLGAPILALVNGLDKSPDEVVASVRAARESFEGHGCTLAATADTVTSVIPIGMAVSTTSEFITGKPSFVGEATVEVKVTDARTGQLLGPEGVGKCVRIDDRPPRRVDQERPLRHSGNGRGVDHVDAYPVHRELKLSVRSTVGDSFSITRHDRDRGEQDDENRRESRHGGSLRYRSERCALIHER